MAHHNPDLATLIGSRICHDLISPIGAISNGLELIEMGGAAQSPEFALINDSAAHASGRIQFFRIAFGEASPQQMTGASEMADIARGVYNGTHNIAWALTEALPRPRAQALFLGLLCIEQAVPRGGTIGIAGSAAQIMLSATGPTLRAVPEIWDILRTGAVPQDLTSKQVQFALLRQVADDMQASLDIAITDTEVRITL